jgi:hypothetical protein
MIELTASVVVPWKDEVREAIREKNSNFRWKEGIRDERSDP